MAHELPPHLIDDETGLFWCQSLPEISTSAWEHPADRAARDAVRRVPGFDALLRRVMGLVSERPLRLVTLGSAVQVGPDQLPALHAVYEDALRVLDCPSRPELYVARKPVVDSGAIGFERPFIVLSAVEVATSTPEELHVQIARELGHIMSEHVLYKTLLRLLLRGGALLLRLPLTGLAVLPVVAALLEWDRKSELSADRASLLALQDPEAVRRSLLRMAGGTVSALDLPAFRDQARRYEEDGSALDSVIQVLTLLNRRHPFPVQRMRELDRWIESGAYEGILSGRYPLRGTEQPEAEAEYWSEAMGEYAQGAREVAREAAGRVSSAVGGLFRRRLRRGEE
jgi:Zn-dependent protease with chaperone function